MRSIRRTTLFLVLSVFAAGFAGSAFAQRDCSWCTAIYDTCMAQPDADQGLCAREHNRCAEPMNCPLMPEF
ncbi:hypothetical protein D9T17_02895 [Lysobacter enzymogenes]|uniref:Lipoprotein n=1 Tax=Lysobacter enzymogenes TaxID=69 RepID=A0A3N2RMR7_LYSEN|nr:hypothetical protein [Lysobacter enzymogenes]ROU08753.1 hypothetical protein D9T17_02895 [Lysobacter enzymogenes]